MTQRTGIKLSILAPDNNSRGDLLTRLSVDLFHTLGYENFLVNVAKSGREVDISGDHRFENSKMIAECKASKGPIGGADINKFAGVLDAERRSGNLKSIHGYFVSTGGFRDSARAQEENFLPPRVILLDGPAIIKQLVNGGTLISSERALARVARVCEANNIRGTIDPHIELLAHEHGWIWCVYVRHGRLRTHACLVHADGEVIADELCTSIKESADQNNHELAKYPLLNPRVSDLVSELSAAKQRYLDYIRSEYDSITLEGLPADHEVGAQRFRLDDLYVELTVENIAEPEEVRPTRKRRSRRLRENGSSNADNANPGSSTGMSIGRALTSIKHMAILGLPGAGKTTLLKHLAVSYADPNRRTSNNDFLPAEEWLPVVLRCRHLGDMADKPIMDIVRDLATRAEMPELAQAFQDLVRLTLREGKLLLLVDGLDEIRSPSSRQAFVVQLRTFLSKYPNVNLVITSRETGYRVVAGAVRSFCKPLRVAPLSDAAITDLTLAWHRHVIGPSAAVAQDARALATAIRSSDRVHRLATNPLMLTTLLLVKRWVGQLPRRRSVLYQKAIEVLLMTWNVEGHEPLDQDEAIPQLSYVAYCMMDSGKTSVTAQELTGYISQARTDLPEVLAYTSLSVAAFVRRVEERSSLLTASGVTIEYGQLVDVYEFKHLTFQEYLAALAIANGYLPREIIDLSPIEVIGARFKDDTWREVVALTAVLSGRGASDLVRHLMVLVRALKSRSENSNYDDKGRTPYDSLVGCLEDEVSIAPQTAREAIELCVRKMSPIDERRLPNALHGGRYSQELISVCLDELKKLDANAMDFGGAIGQIRVLEIDSKYGSKSTGADECISELLKELNAGGDRRLVATSALMILSYRTVTHDRNIFKEKPVSRDIGPAINNVVEYLTETPDIPDYMLLMALWAMCWGAAGYDLSDEQVFKLRRRAVETWLNTEEAPLQHVATWLIRSLPLNKKPLVTSQDKDSLGAFLKNKASELDASSPDSEKRLRALSAHLVAHQAGLNWSKKDLIELLKFDAHNNTYILRRLEGIRKALAALGEEGLKAARGLDEDIAKRNLENPPSQLDVND
ncbi:NACHT domain-containing protein [Streptosporangium sp. NPDC000563]|uniref:NACHT domain-containing protein n=1 Tax=Streptosporangium sp. NPDC000563 TaxID=3154366 RepID=UPI00332BA79C